MMLDELLISQYQLTRVLGSDQALIVPDDAFSSTSSIEITQVFDQIPNQCQAVSFDLFDTLVFRNRSLPESLTNSLAWYCYFALLPVTKKTIKLIDIKHCLQMAESEAKGKWRAKGKDYECTLSEWVNLLLVTLSARFNATGSLTEIGIINFIVEREASGLLLTPGVNKQLELIRESGRKIIVISDTWYTREQIFCFLSGLGVNGLVDEVYSSGECRLNKASGRLYEYVLKNEGLTPAQLSHFGDNLLSDVKQARASGIRSMCVRSQITYRQLEERRYFEKRLNLLADFRWFESQYIANKCLEISALERAGFESISLSFCLFTLQIIQQSLRLGINEVVFLARDGFVFQELIEKAWRVLENTYELPPMQFIYLQVGRALISSYMEGGDKRVLATFLKSNGIDCHSANPLLLVDIGWNGSLGNSISKYFLEAGSNKQVECMLWGRTYHVPLEGTENYRILPGFAFDEKRPNPIEHSVQEFRELFELAACGPGGTVVGLESKDGDCVALTDPNFSRSRQSASAELQRGIFRYADTFFELWSEQGWTIEPLMAEASLKISQLVMDMPLDIKRALSSVDFETGAGNSNTMKLVSATTATPVSSHVAHKKIAMGVGGGSSHNLQYFFNALEHFINSVPADRKTIVYGAGVVAKQIVPRIVQNIAYIVDLDRNLHGKELCGVEIRNIDALANEKNIQIIVTPLNRKTEILRLLSEISANILFVDDIL